MNDIGNIGGPDRTGQGGGSGNYYVPMRSRQQLKTETQKLKVGEVVLGTVLEMVDKEIAKVKLPMGTFTASLHGKLRPGDVLFFYVAEVEPQLILLVHSVSTSFSGKPRPVAEIARVLNLPDNQRILEIIDFLSVKKSTILRTEVLNFSNILDNLNFNENIHSKTAYFSAIFTVFITLGKDVDLARRFVDVFLPSKDIYNKLSQSFDKFGLQKLYLLKTDLSEISNSDDLLQILSKISEYNIFANANSQPIVLLFLARKPNENVIIRVEIFADTPAIGIKPNLLQIVSSFSDYFSLLIEEYLKKDNLAQSIIDEKDSIIEKLDKYLLKSSCLVSHFSLFSDKSGEYLLKEGVLRALPRNFTVVI
ncbi:MAG TPA: hypothetical protein PLV01_01265 [Candidatus Kapabacteria bacterium]|nr:hypothetical protein [Candidatus Kapabacteria bacterium]